MHLYQSENWLRPTPGGSRYGGEWKNGKRHGQGTYTFPDGARYEGQWKCDKHDGRGVCAFPDGSRCELDELLEQYKTNPTEVEKLKEEVARIPELELLITSLSQCVAAGDWKIDQFKTKIEVLSLSGTKHPVSDSKPKLPRIKENIERNCAVEPKLEDYIDDAIEA